MCRLLLAALEPEYIQLGKYASDLR